MVLAPRLLAPALIALLLVVPASSQASTALVSGTAIAPANGAGTLSLPVMLSGASQRRTHAVSPITRFVFAQGKLPRLRAGDTVTGRAAVPSTPFTSLRVSGVKLVSREQAYSSEELAAALVTLATQVGQVNTTLSVLTRYLVSQQQAGVDPAALQALQAQVTALQTQLAGLKATLCAAVPCPG